MVLSHGLWQRRFAGDTNLVGNSIQLDGESYVVAGVLRPNALPTESEVDFLIPFGWQRQYGAHNLRVIGRLKPGFTPEQARAELAAIKQRMQAALSEVERELVGDGGADARRSHR